MSWSPSASSSRASSWWTDQEPGLRDLGAFARALLLAGRERPLVSLLTSLLFALVVVAAIALLRPDHAPRFVLRVVEPNADPTTLPRARRQLAEYVREGILTSEALLGVMERHDVYPTLRRSNPPAAIESFREDIDIEVHQNYFLEERTVADAPRSARLVLSFRAKEPALALAVTRELGRLVVEREQNARKQQAQASLVSAEVTLERANRALGQRLAEISRKRARLREATQLDPLTEVQLVSLIGSLEWREQELEKSQARKAALELGSMRETHSMGLSFQIADEGAVRKSAELSPLRLCLGGLAAFVGGLPFAAALVGAFAPKRGDP
ncbi:MAG: hypothetical protein HS104_00410 [Polyangiaceae bacterium]|nr:hypothetical protein [Polyangiaceae bacterium]MCL4752793.1 hypothetical protein [Myxococcales bacterium]